MILRLPFFHVVLNVIREIFIGMRGCALLTPILRHLLLGIPRWVLIGWGQIIETAELLHTSPCIILLLLLVYHALSRETWRGTY
jgi:succinate dehydrogenase/fumarate reductase cytochrome b subunit